MKMLTFIFKPPQCVSNILAKKLSKNWVGVFFVVCIIKAIEKSSRHIGSQKIHKIKLFFSPFIIFLNFVVVLIFGSSSFFGIDSTFGIFLLNFWGYLDIGQSFILKSDVSYCFVYILVPLCCTEMGLNLNIEALNKLRWYLILRY